jgi:hypothetical protein
MDSHLVMDSLRPLFISLLHLNSKDQLLLPLEIKEEMMGLPASSVGRTLIISREGKSDAWPLLGAVASCTSPASYASYPAVWRDARISS